MKALSLSRFSVAVVALVVLVTMFVPMVLIQAYAESLEGIDRAGTGEVTVGIAVILRATARRLLRGASSNLMRTTVGTFGRTSARALTRRLVKFTGRLFFSSIVQKGSEDEQEEAPPATVGAQLFSLALGYLALCLSFWGVLRVVSGEVASGIVQTSGLGTAQVVLLAGLPLLFYAGLHHLFGAFHGVRARYRTELDGLLLQAYFTGAGSFLPLTTDVEYSGPERGKRNVAIGAILGLFVLHVVLTWVGRETGTDWLQFLGSVFLVYCFVYCFPIRPLEGHFIWASSKLLWALVTLPILIAFLTWLPPAFGEIL